MNKKNNIIVYIDFKSPYAYLAIEPTRKFAKSMNIKVNWLPYVLEIPDFLGTAKVDNSRNIIENHRNEHQWRRVRYSYMDCRRYANLRDITVLGPQKIWNTKLVSMALLWAIDKNLILIDKLIDNIFINFWKRKLNIENIEIIEEVLIKTGISSKGFKKWTKKKGQTALDLVMNEAHKRGVFGVPSYIFKDELFWGREQIPLIKARITKNYLNIS